MRLALSLALLPLLASAVPTSKPLSFQTGDNELLPNTGFSVDLNELRLVQFAEDEPAVWITELDKIEAKAKGRRFMDITDTPTLGFSGYLLPAEANTRYSYPPPGNYSKPVKQAIKELSIDHMKEFLGKFSGYYRSETGKQSQEFLLSTLKSISSKHSGVTIKEFAHPWGQNSIIAHFAPADVSNKDAPVTIIGAHQDSTNQWPFLPAPGADDDGSGTTSSLEAFRALVSLNFTPSAPVEFHYFSAEEGGLLGSQAVAKAYEDEGRKVLAMLQMDMTAWVKKGTEESVGIIQDYVDPDLTEFMERLVKKYLAIPPVRTQCQYACSDHASFRKAGYQSAFAIESTFENSNHNIHTTQDTTDHPEFSFSHMREFSKLVIAFAIELGGFTEPHA
ncbi:Leucine aminopeptidase 1 [Saitozyma podzolica]|uniref:Peptide hydrolase n=1 Tax=Saitozyma podzolica TaxID=1890683 RepID=A0A427YL75_9TREE|nr:Leucine aminopeptidase 1 [Saitozyma podzolica]